MKERGQGQTNAAEWGRGGEGGGLGGGTTVSFYSLRRKAAKINETYYF